MGIVAPSAHHIGKTKSAPRLRTRNISQNIFRCTGHKSTATFFSLAVLSVDW